MMFRNLVLAHKLRYVQTQEISHPSFLLRVEIDASHNDLDNIIGLMSAFIVEWQLGAGGSGGNLCYARTGNF